MDRGCDSGRHIFTKFDFIVHTSYREMNTLACMPMTEHWQVIKCRIAPLNNVRRTFSHFTARHKVKCSVCARLSHGCSWIHCGWKHHLNWGNKYCPVSTKSGKIWPCLSQLWQIKHTKSCIILLNSDLSESVLKKTSSDRQRHLGTICISDYTQSTWRRIHPHHVPNSLPRLHQHTIKVEKTCKTVKYTVLKLVLVLAKLPNS